MPRRVAGCCSMPRHDLPCHSMPCRQWAPALTVLFSSTCHAISLSCGMKTTRAQSGTATAVLSCYRYDKSRYNYKDLRPERDRRWAVTSVAKFSFYCTAMILFCVLMYIPVYNRANEQLPKVVVAGWPIRSNRDTKIYVQPDHVTTVHEPKDVCPKNNRDKKNSLFLLIVVCSSTVNFDRRIAIRETWGNHQNYIESGKVYKAVQEKYKNYNYTYNLDEELAKALQENLISASEAPEEKRFEYEKGEDMLSTFDMNKELNGQDDVDLDYDYESNIMKISPRGFEDSPDLDRVISLLKKSKEFPKIDIVVQESANREIDFKHVFLLGLPFHANDTEIQDKIEDEVDKYGDIIQEDFIDSYNNLTLKSIMMLKWVTNNCNESVRYILKTDDDMYVNVPNLVQNLRNRSMVHDNTKGQEKEYMLIGDLICGARPVQDSGNQWYSPRYMYGGRVYPRYLSGTGYALSAPAAISLYHAALRTVYFHLEDIYITGMCSVRASPRIAPRDEPGFSYDKRVLDACAALARLTTHRVSPALMRTVAARLLQHAHVDRCERLRLTQVRKERLKPKQPPKKLSKPSLSFA